MCENSLNIKAMIMNSYLSLLTLISILAVSATASAAASPKPGDAVQQLDYEAADKVCTQRAEKQASVDPLRVYTKCMAEHGFSAEWDEDQPLDTEEDSGDFSEPADDYDYPDPQEG